MRHRSYFLWLAIFTNLPWLEHRREDIAPSDMRGAAYVIHVAVESVTHEMRTEPDVDTEAIVQELGDMVLRYLSPSG